MKKLLITLLGTIGVLALLLNFIPINCEVTSVFLTQSPANSHKIEVSSRVCKNKEDNGIYLSIEKLETKTIHEAKILPSNTNDIKFNWLTTNDLEIIVPKNFTLVQSSGQILGINYKIIYK